jgi:hypothetical protein
MYNNSHSAAGPNESGVKTAHEYIRDILPFRYQKCISCGNRTDLTCVRCSYCYSCHWKKEKEERRLVEDKISEIFPSPFLRSGKKVSIENEVQQQPLPARPKRQLIVDVHGRTSEPICSYHGCDHNFSVHGLVNCKCKHPTNRTLGVFTKYS